VCVCVCVCVRVCVCERERESKIERHTKKSARERPQQDAGVASEKSLFSSSALSLQVLEGPWALSCVMQESMRLKYEPASEPLHISVEWLFGEVLEHMGGLPHGHVGTGYLEKGIQTPMAQDRSTKII